MLYRNKILETLAFYLKYEPWVVDLSIFLRGLDDLSTVSENLKFKIVRQHFKNVVGHYGYRVGRVVFIRLAFDSSNRWSVSLKWCAKCPPGSLE